jgi:hypothetical protein
LGRGCGAPIRLRVRSKTPLAPSIGGAPRTNRARILDWRARKRNHKKRAPHERARILECECTDFGGERLLACTDFGGVAYHGFWNRRGAVLRRDADGHWLAMAGGTAVARFGA